MSSIEFATAKDELCFLGVAETAAIIRQRKVSPVEVATAYLQQIERLDGALHAFFHFDGDLFMEQARTAEHRLATGEKVGPLHGVPIGIKDLVETIDMPTSGGMPFLADHHTGRDATIVKRLRAAGALIAGKLATPQGAWADYPPPFIFPKNPWNTNYWPGNSSTGSGVAVAAGMVAGSIGTETGGSVRLPCAVNGVTGLKPTWGRISRSGVHELAGTLDHVCPMAPSARDVALMLSVLAGRDENDATSLLAPTLAFEESISLPVRDMILGIDHRWIDNVADEATVVMIKSAVDVFAHAGVKVVEVRIPDYSQVVDDWNLICSVQASIAHQQWYPEHADQYGETIAAVIEGAKNVPATMYQEALERRAIFKGRLGALFSGIDFMILPITSYSDLTLELYQAQIQKGDFISMLMQYNCPFPMAEVPCLALPGAQSRNGTPMGFQLISGSLCEAKLLSAGVAFQTATDWHRRRPSLARG